MNLQLTPADAELLHEMLTQYLRELRREIARTEHKEFRAELRQRESLLDRLVTELESSGTVSAGLS
jgi:hypothetical protein